MNRLLACAAILVASVTSASAASWCQPEADVASEMASNGFRAVFRALTLSTNDELVIYRSEDGRWVAGLAADGEFCKFIDGEISSKIEARP